jgi:hypothetical protein
MSSRKVSCKKDLGRHIAVHRRTPVATETQHSLHLGWAHRCRRRIRTYKMVSNRLT